MLCILQTQRLTAVCGEDGDGSGRALETHQGQIAGGLRAAETPRAGDGGDGHYCSWGSGK